MSLDDFLRLTPDEFEAVHKSWADNQSRVLQGEWERLRTLGAITIQPHVQGRITPRQLLPMPWDEKEEKPREKPQYTQEQLAERKDRLRQLFEA